MLKRTIARAQADVMRRVRTRHQQIKPLPLQGLFNFRCHENCVQYVKAHPERPLDIVEVITVEEGGGPALHYLLFDRGTSDYLEVTLGWRIDQHEVYLVRTLLEADHPYIHREFLRSREDWAHQFLSRFWRRFIAPADIL
ncbi:hypothetical protein CPT_Sonora_075 [Stenotrophomonas phage Sonora]|nr:hypothetical protein CPT_Sonora_075 [Stenotrophomonas phage Sonora]